VPVLHFVYCFKGVKNLNSLVAWAILLHNDEIRDLGHKDRLVEQRNIEGHDRLGMSRGSGDKECIHNFFGGGGELSGKLGRPRRRWQGNRWMEVAPMDVSRGPSCNA
jgi:hypothetical protein